MTQEMWVDANRDALEKAYNELYRSCLEEDGVLDQESGNWKALHQYEDALVALGILEADEEEPEEADEYDSETHYDEWVADQRYDAYRDFDLAMGYER